MNQRQLKRSKLLVDVIANKVLQKHKKALADMCINRTTCGSKGCVWGDFVVAMRGVDLKRLNADLKDNRFAAGGFADFASYVSNPTLKSLTYNLDYWCRDGFAEYFGVTFAVERVFGATFHGTWFQRYKYFVGLLQEQGVIYDPLQKVTK